MSRPPISFSGYRKLDGTVDDFADLLNPENWKTNVPLLWQESGRICPPGTAPASAGPVDALGLPTNRDEDPSVMASTGPWADPALFFENVTFGFVSSQRNVLQTTYTKTPAAAPLTRVDFTYEQFECLSSIFLFQENAGGIDVDSGGASCVEQAPGSVRLDINKAVRFTQPADELPLVDLVTSVAVQLVMDLLLYGIVAPNP